MSYAYDHGEPYAHEHCAQRYGEPYADPINVGEHTEIPPLLLERFTCEHRVIGGLHSMELVMSVIRGDDMLGWHNNVSLAVRADCSGQWQIAVPSVGSFQPLAYGDGAQTQLATYEATALWRFSPERIGPFHIWGYVFVNGRFVPFDQLAVSPHYIDSNGAPRLMISM